MSAYTDADFEAAWNACAKVRDAAPRVADDASSDDVVKAILDAVAPAIAARALREAADAFSKANPSQTFASGWMAAEMGLRARAVSAETP